MNEWEKCQKRFPHRTSLTAKETKHISIFFTDHFAATDKGQRFLFAYFEELVLWSAGPKHPWRYLEDNDPISEELLTAKYLDKEYITDLQMLEGTGQYKGKEVKYSTTRNCWTYLNNRTVHFHGTSASETPDSPANNDTARVEEILERTDMIVSSAIQKLQAISQPASPATQASTHPQPTQTSSLPTPPMSKGKPPAPVPPRTRTPTSRSSAPKASTSQGPAQAPLPQPAAPQLPPGNLPNPPAPAAMAQQNQPRILGTAPDPYDGSPDKAIDFWNTLANYYNINDGIYTTNAQKVSSALTHFKIGTPGGKWASDLMHTALNTNPVNYGTWDDFKATFDKQFIPPAA